ncbi:tyrosine-type recombinase/integrase [Paenibacillus cremeus]|uniref:Site-specific integrase n=1 Tax=Paenibacillus cremeus TaxID=2163881 RepID=A0A559K537_9BACL|nr:tyrosine-type recombinase/integrase [Paenibacillus cremeus]TVY07203.1 site-specific integrase [Paenibacillus cremeus]
MKVDGAFFDHVKGFLTVYLPKQKCCSKHTIKSYRETINLLRMYLLEAKKVPFTKITFELFNFDLVCGFLDWLQHTRGCSASTRNQRLAGLNAFFNYAAIQDPALMAVYMKVKKVPVQKTGQRIVKYMTEAALKTVLEQPNTTKRNGLRDRFFMILLYDTGARVQELLDLKLKDFCLESTSTAFVYLTGKGDKTRTVPMLDKTIRHLNEYLARFHPEATDRMDQYLFYTVINGQKGQMSAENVASFLRRYGNSARSVLPEVPPHLHAHLFRHSRAMHLYQMGIPLSYIKDFLGHSHINTTTIYASADLTMMKEALEKVSKSGMEQERPIWQDNEDMILSLCGLK